VSTGSAPGGTVGDLVHVVDERERRTPLNCSRSANTSISVNCAKFATLPLTSHSTTRSCAAGRFGLCRVSIGTPPV
jgi:hypothetical protein